MKGVGKRIFGLCAETFGLNKRIQGPLALILRLHRVLPQKEHDKQRFQRTHAITEEGLDHLLTYLQRHYSLIQVDDYLNLEPSSQNRRERFACLTFDDGGQDNYLYAWPQLKSQKIPASIYLSAGHIRRDLPFWWLRLGDAFAEAQNNAEAQARLKQALESITPNPSDFDSIDRFMDFIYTLSEEQRNNLTQILSPHLPGSHSVSLKLSEIQEMSASGLIRFGAQTASHLPLPLLDEAAAIADIRSGFAAVSALEGVHFNRLFCYPNGAYDHRLMEQVESAGFQGALTGFASYASRQERERFCLPRVNVSDSLAHDSPLLNFRLLAVAAQRAQLLNFARKNAA
ncbi:Predicted polysaccharide deacetylase family protein [gamma proteobacterium HdN1]|nr:Predicted polysaccharide deacetylase family protein [gamma proteobacterium HdN1]